MHKSSFICNLYFSPKIVALQIWSISIDFFFAIKHSCVVQRRVREEAKGITVKLMKVNALSPSGQRIKTKMSSWKELEVLCCPSTNWGGGLVLLSTDLWEENYPFIHHKPALIPQGAHNRNAVLQ